MRVLERSLATVQNNVTNASTPGYASQTQVLLAQRFNPAAGLAGGVTAGELVSSRSTYAEQAVRRQTSSWGRSDQSRAGLVQVESVFDIAENSGIASALSRFYQSFSLLSVSPNDTSSRQIVLDRAAETARSFNLAAENLGQAAARADADARNFVDSINRLATRIAEINHQRRQDFHANQDAGLDARLHSALDELAELVDFTALPQADGGVSIFIGGQTPVVLGERALPISVEAASGSIVIRDHQGNDVTGQLTKGRLGAVLELRNTHVTAFKADLDRLAQTFADRVNAILAGGLDLSGQAPSVDLFTYNAAAGAARTIAVTAITPAQIAAAGATAPGGNANALAVASLNNTREIDGFTFIQFYGTLAARAGREVASATDEAEAVEQVLLQAKSFREEISGVSLDAEAARLIELQRGYQAVGKLLTVLNDLTGEIFQLVR